MPNKTPSKSTRTNGQRQQRQQRQPYNGQRQQRPQRQQRQPYNGQRPQRQQRPQQRPQRPQHNRQYPNYKHNTDLCPHTTTNSVKVAYVKAFSCKNFTNRNTINQRLSRAKGCLQMRKIAKSLTPANRRNHGHNFVINLLTTLKDECASMLQWNNSKRKLKF